MSDPRREVARASEPSISAHAAAALEPGPLSESGARAFAAAAFEPHCQAPLPSDSNLSRASAPSIRRGRLSPRPGPNH